MTPSIFIQYLSAPCSKICKQRWGLTIRNVKMRSSLFTDDTIIYIENIKVSTEKLLGWMSSQIQDKYLKINFFPYASNNQLQDIIENRFYL